MEAGGTHNLISVAAELSRLPLRYATALHLHGLPAYFQVRIGESFARSTAYHSCRQPPARHVNLGEIMGAFSIWHWLIIFFIFSSYIVPTWRIVSKAGFSGAWSLLSFVPVLNLIMLWVFAFSTWPRERA